MTTMILDPRNATNEPEVEYSCIAFVVVSDDVTLGDLYEDAHSCYSEADELEEEESEPRVKAAG